MQRAQRIAAYGLLARPGEVLMVRSGAGGRFPGRWSLPGGGVDHGEHPADALRREFREETGLIVQVAAGPRAYSDVLVPRTGEKLHTVRLCWDVTAAPGVLCSEEGDSTDRVEWIPLAQALELPEMAPFVGAELRRCR